MSLKLVMYEQYFHITLLICCLLMPKNNSTDTLNFISGFVAHFIVFLLHGIVAD